MMTHDYKCTRCERKIPEFTVKANDGLCIPCFNGMDVCICTKCGVETFTSNDNRLCGSCFQAQERNSWKFKINQTLKTYIYGLPLIRYPNYYKTYKIFSKPEYEFTYIGFNFLGYPEIYDSSPCSPIKSKAIGETGGDYVHFSILFVNGTSYDNNPIMITLPVPPEEQKDYYLILANNLKEFMAMGVTFGFNIFEEMLTDLNKCLELMESNNVEKDYEEDEHKLIGELRIHFGVFDYSNIKTHISSINKQYKSYLITPQYDQ
ncbi:MAG: hypothetical protein COA79_26500 [Planctomycetota bacterium]|nr:MAG: hypothetical protein COA79_26500 [Planctomycetota bacterium]